MINLRQYLNDKYKKVAEEICLAASENKKISSDFFSFMQETIHVALNNAYDDAIKDLLSPRVPKTPKDAINSGVEL